MKMAPSKQVAAGSALGLLCALRSGCSFISPPTSSGARNLRSASGSVTQSAPAAASNVGLLAATSAAASVLVAAGAAAARRARR
eukprot:CAMPEP_0183509666 /NCGR_PEP_ID=MMETSP0371-20130417/9773_1 /TAXON_ID=268820 /ORGANISM="Peridinium aciculiferum, Strain PAER-2" /LENGTH=83 /DNA_ID=CAMNT_0025706333 /DNA_START=62 /DNA_END=309 /DNA_ORIENTATION=+